MYDGWRRDEDPLPTAENLTALLLLDGVIIRESDLVPVEFNYVVGEVFGGHLVTVEVGADLVLRGVSLS